MCDGFKVNMYLTRGTLVPAVSGNFSVRTPISSRVKQWFTALVVNLTLPGSVAINQLQLPPIRPVNGMFVKALAKEEYGT